MVDKVFLVGEVHFDLDKLNRYQRALDTINPNMVTLERSIDFYEDFPSLLRLVRDIEQSDSLTSNKDYAFASLTVGDVIATYLYSRKQSKNGRRILCEGVDIPCQQMDIVRKQLSHYKSTITQDNLSILYTNIVTLNACGLERCNRVKQSLSVPDSTKNALNFEQRSFLDLVKSGSPEEIANAQQWVDCVYLFENINRETAPIGSMKKRDQFATKRILKNDGLVVHLGGYGHSYGDYDNLYQQLKRKGVSVERMSLLDFAYGNKEELERYKEQLRPLITEVKAEGQSILSEEYNG